MGEIIKFRSRFELGLINTLIKRGEYEEIEKLQNHSLSEYLEKDSLLDAFLRDKDDYDLEGVSFADWNGARIELLKEAEDVSD